MACIEAAAMRRWESEGLELDSTNGEVEVLVASAMVGTTGIGYDPSKVLLALSPTAPRRVCGAAEAGCFFIALLAAKLATLESRPLPKAEGGAPAPAWLAIAEVWALPASPNIVSRLGGCWRT